MYVFFFFFFFLILKNIPHSKWKPLMGSLVSCPSFRYHGCHKIYGNFSYLNSRHIHFLFLFLYCLKIQNSVYVMEINDDNTIYPNCVTLWCLTFRVRYSISSEFNFVLRLRMSHLDPNYLYLVFKPLLEDF